MNTSPTKNKRIFVTDCEGPISKNDNAFELASHFIPNGEKLFTTISKYDDILADVVKKHGYKAGNTLKLILPFLKAYDVTNEKMRNFSIQTLSLMPGAKDTLALVKRIMPSFIVSTSYEHYIRALCSATGFPYENTYPTKIDINKYKISKKEKEQLKEVAQEIAKMPLIEVPIGAKSLQDLSKSTQIVIERLDEIFWSKIQEMQSGIILMEVNPVGGEEKEKVVQDIVNKMNGELSDVMYVGDSITDVECFRLVRKNGGLTVSFNGNQYAIREAEIAVLADNTVVTSVIADVFNKLGKKYVIQFVQNWNHKAFEKYDVSQKLTKHVLGLWPKKLPRVEIVTSSNMNSLMKESGEFRKKVRGEAIGRLG